MERAILAPVVYPVLVGRGLQPDAFADLLRRWFASQPPAALEEPKDEAAVLASLLPELGAPTPAVAAASPPEPAVERRRLRPRRRHRGLGRGWRIV